MAADLNIELLAVAMKEYGETKNEHEIHLQGKLIRANPRRPEINNTGGPVENPRRGRLQRMIFRFIVTEGRSKK